MVKEAIEKEGKELYKLLNNACLPMTIQSMLMPHFYLKYNPNARCVSFVSADTLDNKNNNCIEEIPINQLLLPNILYRKNKGRNFSVTINDDKDKLSLNNLPLNIIPSWSPCGLYLKDTNTRELLRVPDCQEDTTNKSKELL